MAAKREAEIPLEFVIIGGSIAGLATAYALCQAGHYVMVLEKTDGKARSPGSMRCQPNMTRILQEWGLDDLIDKYSLKSTGMSFFVGETGDKLGELRFAERIMRDFRANFLYLQHCDLHDNLLRLAEGAGAQIQYNANVVRVNEHEGSVTLACGDVIPCDIVVGADGPQSLVREVVLGGPLPSKPARRVGFSMYVPFDKMEEDPELASLIHAPTWSVWMGEDISLQGCPVRVQKAFYMILHCPYSGDMQPSETWTDSHPVDRLHLNTEKFEPRVQKLIKLAESAAVVANVDREPFDTWVHENGHLVLVGEAAHPLFPGTHSNGAMALEDAVTLGNLFSRLKSRTQISSLLSAYEDIRQPRANAVTLSERESAEMVAMSNGPMRAMRDGALRMALASSTKTDWDDSDEENLRFCWGQYIPVFVYDANEACDDWWSKWGSRMDKSSGQANGFPTQTGFPMQIMMSSVSSHTEVVH